jgi:hypothetical protein
MHKPVIVQLLVFFPNSLFFKLLWLEKPERAMGKLVNETKEVGKSL